MPGQTLRPQWLKRLVGEYELLVAERLRFRHRTRRHLHDMITDLAANRVEITITFQNPPGKH